MRILTFVLILVFGQSTYSFAAEKKDDDIVVSSQRKIQNLKIAILNREIEGIEVIWKNPAILTQTSVTPELLEKFYGRKLIFRDSWGNQFEKNMLTALQSIVVGSFNDQMSEDVRWGIKFLAKGDSRVVISIYFNSNGMFGSVDKTKVSFKGGGFKWLKENFSHFFLQFDK